MSTARKYAFNNRSMSPQSHNKAIAAIQILWKQMRPDLAFDKEALREERLAWIASFLGLKRELKSITELTDKQLGIVLEEMRRLTGNQASIKRPENNTKFQNLRFTNNGNSGGAEIIHLATEEQQFTAQKLFDFLGWGAKSKEDFLREKFDCPNVPMLTFKKANSLLMILLNIAAHVDLKSKGKPTGRAATTKHIKVIKQKLEIDR